MALFENLNCSKLKYSPCDKFGFVGCTKAGVIGGKHFNDSFFIILNICLVKLNYLNILGVHEMKRLDRGLVVSKVPVSNV